MLRAVPKIRMPRIVSEGQNRNVFTIMTPSGTPSPSLSTGKICANPLLNSSHISAAVSFIQSQTSSKKSLIASTMPPKKSPIELQKPSSSSSSTSSRSRIIILSRLSPSCASGRKVMRFCPKRWKPSQSEDPRQSSSGRGPPHRGTRKGALEARPRHDVDGTSQISWPVPTAA